MSKWRQRGVGLLELMVAMAIGLLVTTAVLNTYLAGKQAYRFQEAGSRVQENARFALDKIAYDLRMAGAMGCVNLAEVEPRMHISPTVPTGVMPAGWAVNKASAITSFVVSGPIAGFVDPLPGSEAVTILRASTTGSPLRSDMADRKAKIAVSPGHGFTTADVLVIADCENVEIFRANEIDQDDIDHSDPPNDSVYLAKAYRVDDGSQVFRLQAWTYYVSGRGGEFELRRRDLFSGDDYAVADGIENIRYRFGVDAGDGVVVRYAETGDPGFSPADAVSVSLQLLARSRDDYLASEPVEVSFDGVPVNAGAGADRRLRRVFSTQIALRNRVALR